MVIAARSLRHEELPFDSRIMSPASVSRANPLDLDFLGIFMDGGRDGHAGMAYMNPSNEIKAQISFDALFPGPRDICVIWSRTEKRWSYLSLLKPNKAPFVVKGFAGAMKHYCNHSLKPAPTLSSEPPYKWFNYDTDTLVFDYTHCGSDEAEIDNFEVAMKTAVRMLCRSRNANPYERELKKLQITYYAQLYNNTVPRDFCPGLKRSRALRRSSSGPMTTMRRRGMTALARETGIILIFFIWICPLKMTIFFVTHLKWSFMRLVVHILDLI